MYHVFVRGENFSVKDLCNAASSLIRPAGIGAPHGQFAVEGLSDRREGWIAFLESINSTTQFVILIYNLLSRKDVWTKSLSTDSETYWLNSEAEMSPCLTELFF